MAKERNWKYAWEQARKRNRMLTAQRRRLAKHLMRMTDIATAEILERVRRIDAERQRVLYLESGEPVRRAPFARGNAIFHLIRDDLPWLCDVITGELNEPEGGEA